MGGAGILSQEFLSLGRCKQRLPLPPNKPMTNQNIIPPKFTLGGNQFIRLTCRAWAGVTERNRQATPKQTGRSVPSKNDSFPIAQVKPFFPCLLQPIYSSPSPTPRSHMQAEQSSIQLAGRSGQWWGPSPSLHPGGNVPWWLLPANKHSWFHKDKDSVAVVWLGG